MNRDEAAQLERELARKLLPGHVLMGLRVSAEARRHDNDDVAFRVDDGRLCVVHLTWSVGTDDRWPLVEFTNGLPDDE